MVARALTTAHLTKILELVGIEPFALRTTKPIMTNLVCGSTGAHAHEKRLSHTKKA